MFVGRHLRQLDEKGRLAIPAEYLNRLAPEDRAELYVTPGRKGCIWLVPKSFWEKEIEQLAQSYESDVPDEFYHHCRLRPLDKAGRILLDGECRALARLGDPEAAPVSVMVCGSGRYMQVWEKAEYDTRSTSPRDFSRAVPAPGEPGAPAAGGRG